MQEVQPITTPPAPSQARASEDMMNQQRKQKTEAWLKWAAQVNANYHDGGMSEEDAQADAGPEPEKYERKFCTCTTPLIYSALSTTCLRCGKLC